MDRTLAMHIYRCEFKPLHPCKMLDISQIIPLTLVLGCSWERGRNSLNTFTHLHSLRVEIHFIPNNVSPKKTSHPAHIFNFQHHKKIPYSGKEMLQDAVE